MGKILSRSKNTICVFVLMLSIIFLAKMFMTTSIGAREIRGIVEANLEKYINYTVTEQDKGTLLQYSVKSGIEYEEDQVPQIKNSEMIINSNQIDGKFPKSVNVIAKSTKLTNGKTSDAIVESKYDANTGIITINASNQNEQGELIQDTISDKSDKDEYQIICYYDTYVDNNQERELAIKVTTNFDFVEVGNIMINNTRNFGIKVSENIGTLTSISSDIEDIYNGNIKSNIINGTNYNTQYKSTEAINISKKEAQEKLEIIQNNTLVETTNSDEKIEKDLGNNGNLGYKSTKILKSDIVRILGEKGILEICDINKNILATINEDTQFEEDGTLTILYENAPEAIVIKTSKIENEGILNIENVKEIKSTFTDIENINVKTTTQLTGINEEIKVIEDKEETIENSAYKFENSKLSEILDAKTNVSVNLDNENWTNEKQNEVEFDINLNANSTQDDMFKNPTFKINLPNEVEKVILGNSSIVYANGLELQEPYLETNDDGSISIIANLSGTQTTYNKNDLGVVTNVRILATVVLKKDIKDISKEVNVVYTNQYSIDKKTQTGNIIKNIQITSYVQEPSNTEKNSQEIQTPNQNANIQSSLGQNTLSAEELSKLQTEVIPTKGAVTLKDGENIYEGEYVKYNIKVTNTSSETMKNVKLMATIPEGLTYGVLETDNEHYNGKYEYNFNESTKNLGLNIGILEAGKSYSIFYEVKADDLQDTENEKEVETTVSTYLEETIANTIQCKNIIKPTEAKIFIRATLDNGANRWNYKVTIEADVKDKEKEAIVQVKLPKEFNLRWITTPGGFLQGIYESTGYEIFDISVSEDNIATIKTKLDVGTFLLEGTMDTSTFDRNSEYSKARLVATGDATVDGITYNSNENRIEIKYQNATVALSSPTEGEEVKYGEKIEYDVIIKNVGGITQSEYTSSGVSSIAVNLTDYLPEELKPVSVTYETYEEKMESIGGEENAFKSTGEYEKKEYTKDINYNRNDTNGNKLPNPEISVTIPEEESITIKIITTAGRVLEKTKIENFVNISAKEVDTKTSNTISHTILPYDYVEPEEPENPDVPTDPENPDKPINPENPDNENQKQSISGVAWIDENEDGQRQTSENLLDGITVMLVDMNNSGTVKAKTKTNNSGYYEFSELSNGEYIVIFRYDTENYSLTDYKKSGVSSSLNSDVTKNIITLQGEKIETALTDILKVNSVFTNIDMGVIPNKTFDLKLDKYISKVTVITKSGTKQQEYDKTQLAKAEIRAKEIDGATVAIEYKLVVTNEGELAGTVGEITDYLPKELNFSSDMNKDWVTTKDNQIKNTTLVNQKIEPGENRTLTLTATKVMSLNSTGTFTNIAEITNATNTQERADKDSTPGNNNAKEDDYSKADIIISISTGSVVIYISIIGGMLLIIGAGVYLIRKYGFTKTGKTLFVFLLFTSTLLFPNLKAFADAPGTAGFCWTSEYIEGYWNDYGSTYFYGGKATGDGHCIQAGAASTESWVDYTYYDFSQTGYDSWTNNDDISIDMRNNENDTIQMKSIGNDYIFGPMNITGTYTGNCTVRAYNRSGDEITGITTCNATGNNMQAIGNSTFYVKMSKDKCSTGISKITATATKTGKNRSYTRYYGYANYNHATYQNLTTNNAITIKTDSSEVDVSNSVEVKWTKINGCLEITKRDADDANVKLANVQITVTCDNPVYSNTVTTDENGKATIENLPTGTYKIEEISNTHYGYTVKASEIIAIYSGVQRELILSNVKQTGNLKINKKDKDNNSNLATVEFKIKDADNKYIIAYVNGEKVQKTTGTTYLTSLETTTNADEATTFITDEKGELEIYNLLIGTYTIIETSVGNNDGYYEVDDDYISWEDGSGNNGNQNTANITVERQKAYNTVEKSAIINDNQKVIADGVYEIETQLNSNKIVEVCSAYPYNNSNVSIYDRNNSVAQKFYFKYLGGGQYNIQAICSSKYFDVWGAAKTPGTNVSTYQANGANNQKWIINNEGNGYYTIQDVNSGLYLDVSNGSIANTTNVQVYTKNNSTAQKFKLNDKAPTKTDSAFNTVTIYNRKKYIDVKGYVWEDIPWLVGKESLENQLYREETADENDKLLANVIVRLKDKDNNIVGTQEKTTDANGNYVFNKVLINGLSEYYIEFEYNGMCYQSVSNSVVSDPLTKKNSSKAYEGEERTTFNSKYAQIVKNQSNNSSGTAEHNLAYTTNQSEYSSSIIYNSTDESKLKKGYETQKYPIQGTDQQYLITATTYNALNGYLNNYKTAEDIRVEGLTAIEDLNLGVKEREQPDLAIAKDIQSVQVKVAGETHIYEYADRFNNQNVDVAMNDPQIKYQSKYSDTSYTRALYASDIKYDNGLYTNIIKAYGKGDVNDDGTVDFSDLMVMLKHISGKVLIEDETLKTRAEVNEDGVINLKDLMAVLKYLNGTLDVKMTYKIAIQNQSTNLSAIVNEITDYCDSKYYNDEESKDLSELLEQDEAGKALTKIGTTINDNGDIVSGSELDYKFADKYTTNGTTYGGIKIDTSKLVIQPGATQYIYVQLTVERNEIAKLIDTPNNEQVNLENVAEITSYTTLDKEGNVYAGIDVDSQPGNAVPGDKNTYEDDTDKAPGIKLVLAEKREVNGSVFLDSTTGELNTGETRQGDGKYTSSDDKPIQGVKVELVNIDGTAVRSYDEGSKTWSDKTTATTDENGNYSFGGFMPGEYQLRFTWGNETYASDGTQIYVQNYKSTIVDEDTYNAKGNGSGKDSEWYKDTFKKRHLNVEWDETNNAEIRCSDAVDNYETRTIIDAESNPETGITNATQNAIDRTKEMDSNTPTFRVNLEYETNKTIGMNEYETDDNGNLVMSQDGKYAVKKEEYKNKMRNLDLGIVERARQQISLDKRIESVKISLADGTLLVNAKVNEDGTLEDETKYVTYIPKSAGGDGKLKIEMDNEIIQSATLDIGYAFKFTNTGEKDYLSKEFYMYGEKQYQNEAALVTIRVDQIVDYLDNNTSLDFDESTNWSLVGDKKNLTVDGGILSTNLKDYISGMDRVLLAGQDENGEKIETNKDLTGNLKPADNASELTVHAYKLLSVNDDEVLENNTEIVKATKTGGATLTTTLGNYNPTDVNTYEADSSKSEGLVILPPTGLITDYILYTIIAITSLGILVAGIILIKKFVIKDK